MGDIDILITSQNRTSSASSQRKCSASHFSSFFSFFQSLLSFTIFGQIERSNFFSFFNLFFVCLDFLLQLVSQFRHSTLVFVILILLKLKLFDTTFSFLERLVSLRCLTLN